MIQNFGEYDKGRVTIVRDICATAKGYEAMTVRKVQKNGRYLYEKRTENHQYKYPFEPL